jgi:hypothetical protein
VNATTNTATEKQVNFIRTLLAEREGMSAAEAIRDALNSARTDGPISRKLASSAIESLMAIKVARSTRPDPHQHARLHPVSTVPEGHYAVASATGNNDLDFYRVDRPTEGRWAGRVFVKRVIGGKADTPVRGAEGEAALARIEQAGVEQAMALYGQEIGRCGRCNRHLTDETSRDLGIGPECRKHLAA